MKIIAVGQNTKEWRIWRGKGIGASDAPTIMGDSPWTTPFELWLEKTGLCERPPSNEYAVAAMRRGHDLEPGARERAEKQLGKLFPPLSAQDDVDEYLRVSLDGYSSDEELLEIKAPNKVDHAKAVAGKVPPKYFPQLQHQFMITGAKKGYYASWDGKSDTVAIVEVFPDAEYIAKLRAALKQFWNNVVLQIPPPITDEDRAKIAKRVVEATKLLANSVKALEILSEAA